jgi:hypothetical protein
MPTCGSTTSSSRTTSQFFFLGYDCTLFEATAVTCPPIPVRKTPLDRAGIFCAVDGMGSVSDVLRKFPAPPIPDFLYFWELDTRKVVLLVSENMYVDISAAIDIRMRLMGKGEWGGTLKGDERLYK